MQGPVVRGLSTYYNSILPISGKLYAIPFRIQTNSKGKTWTIV
jgi:hypothetical protein